VAPALDSALQALEGRLGHRFGDRRLLLTALTHRSALGSDKASRESYQRLEFLGDRVLALAVASMLHQSYPKAEEGELASRLNALVRRETCAEVAVALDMGAAIRLGPSERGSGGRKKSAILGDVAEAIIAAIYLDAGYAAAARFVEANWKPLMAAATEPYRDPKTTLQEWAQGRGLPTPAYEATGRDGPDHAPRFTVEVRIQGLAAGEGQGRSKREAEQAAAEAVLIREGVWISPSMEV
jgi:ribonuclease-3